MGKSHKTCEDYALTNTTSCNMFAISDGCSSTKNSDFGSRILLKALEFNLKQNNFFAIDDLWKKSKEIVNSFSGTILESALDATILCGAEINDNVVVNCMGDGVVVAQYIDGKYDIYDIDYSANAPYYITYMFNDARQFEYNKLNQQKNYTIKSYDEKGVFIKESIMVSKNTIEIIYFHKNLYKSISVFSDGVKTLFSNTLPSKPLESIIKELITFPQTNGDFVKRRCNAFIKKNHQYAFSDDFSMASCYMENV